MRPLIRPTDIEKRARGILSFRILDVSGKCILGCALALTMCGLLDSAHAQKSSYKVLHTFAGGSDGSTPYAGLIQDKVGNLYGTTVYGGGMGCENQGCGTVFKLAPNGTETVLHAFTGTNGDGAAPYYAGLIADKGGNLYGTTAYGGIARCAPGFGCGTVFKLAPDGTETVLYAFTGTNGDGIAPQAGLIMDEAGNLYGTTGWGGDLSCGSGSGCGTVFKLAPDGAETVLHAFTGTNVDGSYPIAGLTADKAGNLYGTTVWRGGSGCLNSEGCGIVFKVAPDGTETVLHIFTGGTDGSNPVAGLIMDKAGNFYGTTQAGGKLKCRRGLGCGTVFKVTPDGAETVLYAFLGRSDGSLPNGALLADTAGNLYGTTVDGGGPNQCGNCGTVFKLAPDGTETVLYNIEHKRDGFLIEDGLIADNAGNLYGTMGLGGRAPGCDNGGCGVVFELKNGESGDK